MVVENGRLMAVETLPGHPTGGALCAKGRAAPEMVHSPRRLTKPLRRTAPRDAADPGWIDIATSVPLLSTGRARQELGWVPRKDGVDAVAEAVRGVSDRTKAPGSPHLGGTR